MEEDEIVEGDRKDQGPGLFPAVVFQTLLFMQSEGKDKIPSPAICQIEVLKLFRTRRALHCLPQPNTVLTLVKTHSNYIKEKICICNENGKNTDIQLRERGG